MKRNKLIVLVLLVQVMALVTAACGSAEPSVTGTIAEQTQTVKPSSTTIVPPATTVVALPKVSTSAATGVTASKAVLNGTVDVTGGESIDERGFEWGTGSGKYTSSWEESGSFSAGKFSHELTGLEDGSTYYFRSKAHNNAGWEYGAEMALKTLALPEIAAVTPDTGEQEQTLAVTIVGTGFSGTTAVDFGDGVTVNRFEVSGDMQITANITIAPETVTGDRVVSLVTPVGSSAVNGKFTVILKQPVVRTVVWSNDDFGIISRAITGTSTGSYVTKLHPDGKVDVIGSITFVFGLEIEKGKLVYTDVPSFAWENMSSEAKDNMTYDYGTQRAMVNIFPDEIMQIAFGDDIKSLPELISVTTAEGGMTVTFYVPE